MFLFSLLSQYKTIILSLTKIVFQLIDDLQAKHQLSYFEMKCELETTFNDDNLESIIETRLDSANNADVIIVASTSGWNECRDENGKENRHIDSVILVKHSGNIYNLCRKPKTSILAKESRRKLFRKRRDQGSSRSVGRGRSVGVRSRSRRRDVE